jgi:hypothetical protein
MTGYLNTTGIPKGEFVKKKLTMATGAPGRFVDAQGGPRQIEVTAKRFDYAPGEITLEKMTSTLHVVR